MASGKELSQKFLNNLDDLRKKKGDALAIADIENLFREAHGTERDTIYRGIQDIAGRINSTKLEISSLDEGSIKDANLELNAVVKHTERAANEIMDAAEKIQALAGGLKDGTGSKISDLVTKLFEACDFQDITGQRIGKVVATLIDIEESVKDLLAVLEGKADIEVINKKQKKRKDNRPDAELMNGPQLESETPSQDDIDKLFAGS